MQAPPRPGSLPKGQYTMPAHEGGTPTRPDPLPPGGMGSKQQMADELMLLNVLKSGGKLSRSETVKKLKAAGASESAISAVMRNFKDSIQ